MRITQLLFALTVSSKKYIINMKNKNPDLNTITIGDAHFAIVDYPEFPDFFLKDTNVLSIEEDQEVKAMVFNDLNPEPNVVFIDNANDILRSYYVQRNPIWNLDRIDQREEKLNNIYYHVTTGGKETNVYIVDTGIDINHPEFKGRAKWGGNFVDKVNTDCNMHGTHCAGTVGSTSYGVSKLTNLIAVKVLNCEGSGSYSGVLAGLEFVFKSHKEGKKPSVVNMSLGGPGSQAMDSAVEQLTKNGIVVVVAAGNENENACNSSPSRSKSAITVGATNKKSEKAQFSNWGNCVSIFAPGTEILSTVPCKENECNKVLQGTSMSAPAVAGVVANLLTDNPTFSPDTIKKLLEKRCTRDIIKGLDKASPNCFLFSLV
jgi:subtilisin family serine protease